MPKYVIFNTINSDGVGDFTHFEDIIKMLLANPKFKHVEFISIVCFEATGLESNYVRIGERLRALGIRFFYGKNDDHARLSSDFVMQKLLNEVEQVILISYDSIFELYEPYVKQGIPIKYIGDHEGAQDLTSFICTMFNKGRDMTNYKQRNLGLSRKCHGIKIQQGSHLSVDEAWGAIEKSDPAFSTQLLACTHSSDFKTFSDNYILIPAYFNITSDFFSFLYLFGINDSFVGKDIIIYHSGRSLDGYTESETWNAFISNMFKDTVVRQIEMINPGNYSAIIAYANQVGLKTIKILSGFNLSDSSFNAMYQLAKIAGVSGDNTLERCISMNVLPYYWSTNAFLKIPTLSALQQITQLPELNFSQEVKDSYNIFFDPYLRLSFHSNMIDSNNSTKSNKYKLLNFQKMIEEWPKITSYLKQNKNFYNNLENIILESISIKSLSAPIPRAESRHGSNGLFNPLKPSIEEIIDDSLDISMAPR
ncbi:MAG: hypothetical protein Q8R83_09305 [Legionellaceae bacterium]|nr:hypothetical protein [Legionellaceae bacterium]